MKKKQHSLQYRFRKALALALAAVTLSSAVPAAILTAGAADNQTGGFRPTTVESDQYNIVTYYEWHHVDRQEDLPTDNQRHPVLIMWHRDNKIYYVSGSCYDQVKYNSDKYDCENGYEWPKNDPYYPKFWYSSGGSSEYDASRFPESFFTLDAMTTWTMWWDGNEDDDNNDAARVRFYPLPNILLCGDGDFDYSYNRNTDSHDRWTVYTDELGGDYDDNLHDIDVKIFHNKSGADVGFEYTGSKLFGFEAYTHDYDPFLMYWAETRTFSAITDNYVVGEGQVMNIDDGVVIMDGVSIIVEPGGVLSIEGQLYNNGSIYNQGTVLLQQNACVSSFMPSSEDAGRIICDGGVVEGSRSAQMMHDLKVEASEKVVKLIAEKRAEVIEQINVLQPLQTWLGQLTDAQKKDIETAQALYDKAQQTFEESGTLGDVFPIEEVMSAIVKKVASMAGTEGLTQEELSGLIIHDLVGKKYPIWEQYEDVQQKAAVASAQVALLREEEAALQNRKKVLDQEAEDWGRQVMGNRDRKLNGEGNLILLQNSKLVLNQHKSNSVLLLTENANLICNGYLVSPWAIQVENSQVMIREDGVIFGNYYFTDNLSLLASLQPINAGSDSVTFPGLSSCSSGALGAVYQFTRCLLCEGEYSIICHGILKYSCKGPVDTTSGTDIGTVKRYRDAKTGALIVELEDGTKEITALDGTLTTVYPPSKEHPNGYQVTVYLDGRREVTENGVTTRYALDGSFSKWQDGRLIEGGCYLEDGSYIERIRDRKLWKWALRTVYPEPYTNGIKEKWAFDDGSVLTVYNNGTEEYCDEYGFPVYSKTYEADRITYVHDEYTEELKYDNTYGEALTSIRYTGGYAAGAYVDFGYIYTEILNNVYNASVSTAVFPKFGEPIWTVHAINGESVACKTYKLYSYYDPNLPFEKSGSNAILLDFGAYLSDEVTRRPEDERYLVTVGAGSAPDYTLYLLGLPEDPTYGSGYTTGTIDLSNSRSRELQTLARTLNSSGRTIATRLETGMFVYSYGNSMQISVLEPNYYSYESGTPDHIGMLWTKLYYEKGRDGWYREQGMIQAEALENIGYDSRYDRSRYPYVIRVQGSDAGGNRVWEIQPYMVSPDIY